MAPKTMTTGARMKKTTPNPDPLMAIIKSEPSILNQPICTVRKLRSRQRSNQYGPAPSKVPLTKSILLYFSWLPATSVL